MTRNVIDNLVKLKLCTGCGLCANIFGKENIEIDYDKFGFLTPKINHRLFGPKELEIFKSACPGIKACHDHGDAKSDIFLGSYRSLVTGYSTDDELRFLGSTGGGLSALCIYLIESGKVEGIIQVGQSTTNPFKCETRVSRSKEEILSNTGSKYFPSSPLIILNDLINVQGSYAFVGRPCDIVALRNYLEIRQELKGKITVFISFLCGGSPSIQATKDIINTFGPYESAVEVIRYRGRGWPGSFQVITSARVSFEMSYHQSWGKFLGRNVPLRCKNCFDGVGEAADIVFGDAWYTDKNGNPDFSNRDGRNLILTRSIIGERLLHEGSEQGYLHIENSGVTVQEYQKMQPSHSLRRKAAFARMLAMRAMLIPYPKYNNRHLFKSSMKGSLTFNVYQFLGMIKRLVIDKFI